MDLPSALPLEVLVATHPDFDPPSSTPSGRQIGTLEKHCDLYEGGERFERNKGVYLRVRQMDSHPAYRAARLAAAHYTGQMASLIDWLAGSAFQSDPKIESDDPYWSGLNEDADGTGEDLAAVLYSALTEALVHRRAYLGVSFPAEADASLAAARMPGGSADGRIFCYRACDVDDWGEDSRGQLIWVRVHRSEPVRSGPAQADTELHSWTYITPEGQRSYFRVKKIQEKWDGKGFVSGAEFFSHNYGGMLPVARVEVPMGLWVSGRLASTQLAIFNADAALAFLYDANCFQFPVISNPSRPTALNLSELNALYLEPGGSAAMLAPSGTPFEQLRAYIDKLEARLYLSVQAMALQAASKDEHGRQSGVAKQRDMDAAHVLMACYRGRLKDALLKIIAVIKYVRNETDGEIEISGLDQAENTEEKSPSTRTFWEKSFVRSDIPDSGAARPD